METMLGKKPYKFVPFNKEISRTKPISHNGVDNKKAYSGKLKITIETFTPIHIGQGSYSFDKAGVIVNFIRRNNRITIPGSSFKGMLRSVYEAFSESCTPALPNKCKELENAFPNHHIDMCDDKNNLCPTCSVFGMVNGHNSYKSKLRFGDFTLEDDEKTSIQFIKMPALKAPFTTYPEFDDNNRPHCFTPKTTGYGNERLYYADLLDSEEAYDNFKKADYFSMINGNTQRNIKFRGRKFYLHNDDETKQMRNNDKNAKRYEMVSVGKKFTGEIIFQDLSQKELAILALSLSLADEDNFKYKIGYGKPAYYGSIKITIDNVINSRYNKDSISLQSLKEFANDYKNNASENLKISIEKLSKILTNTKLGPEWTAIDGNRCY
ncbi:MAG: RAMP superfamily CRISPR-associated protein [Clostridium sp.]|nr:RAMP superfamily CRISPR-associated protein [Clostridium sp.]